jgi:hypothetical protein
VAGESEVWFDSVAQASNAIVGLEGAIHAAGSGNRPDVNYMVKVLEKTPAGVWFFDGGTPQMQTSGLWRITYHPELRIYMPRDDLGMAFSELMKYPTRVLTAMPKKSKAYLSLEALTCTGFQRVVFEEWPPTQDGTGKFYLVLPVTFDAVQHLVVDIQPA